ncbi:MAG: single-stranded DNA-binding protein [Firmicutes bacterium]|nr:single-stranded DNA-binding protein [Bacillota bacterium]
MLNRVVLIGRLTRDPELRYLPSGQPVATFTLAVDRPFAGPQGERKADFIPVVAWRKLAEQVSQHLAKGRLVAVDGRLQIREYETQDGQRRRAVEVVADHVRFLDRKAPEPVEAPAEEFEPAPEPEEEEDVPF